MHSIIMLRAHFITTLCVMRLAFVCAFKRVLQNNLSAHIIKLLKQVDRVCYLLACNDLLFMLADL